MFDQRFLKLIVLSIAMVLTPAAASAGPGGFGGGGGPATLGGALVRCSAVTSPATLSGCGTDPLTQGMATIDGVGDVDVEVSGAAATETYGVVFRSPNGGSSIPIGNLTTGSSGDGSLREKTFFAFGSVGAGNLVLTRGGDEYVTGFTVPASSTSTRSNSADLRGPGYEAGLVTCASVKVPAGLTGCGSDTLSRGNVIEGDGSVAILISGAAASETYTAILRSPTGSQVALGSLTTNSKGTGTLIKTGAFPADATASGTFVLQRLGSDQFLSGFDVNQKPIVPLVSEANLVTCAAVVTSNPGLTGETCGTDPLTQGSVQVNASGQVSVRLTGALPSGSYEVFFRLIDGTTDTDTGLALSADTSGNATGSVTFFKSGTSTTGNFVVKNGTMDEFISGFVVN